MSIKQIKDHIGDINIADGMDEQTLIDIGARVKRQFDQDKESMIDWEHGVDEGIKLMKQEWHSRSTPWEGASNYKDPLLTKASVIFGDKAKLELLRQKDLISAEIVGKDETGEKKARSERVTTAMNYQLNHDMSDWRGDQGKMFYVLPNTGATFKKVVYDPVEQISESHVIQYPDFAINQATKSMDTCRSFSHILSCNKDEYDLKVKSGRWLEQDIFPDQPQSSDKLGDTGSNEDAEVTDSVDNPDAFIEQQCFYDIDDDGYEEPYIITIHSQTRKVVRIVARYDEQSIMVSYQDKVMTLPKAEELQKRMMVDNLGGEQMVSLVGYDNPDLVGAKAWDTNYSEFKLLKILPFQQIADYGFLPAPDGTFLCLGYAHVLGPYVMSINATTNQLHDAGTAANGGGGLLPKEFRKEMGVLRTQPGKWTRTNVAADKMMGILPNPNQEPSQVLMALNQAQQEKAEGLLAVVDISGKIQANTAPTTALAIIEESLQSTSALFMNILEAESREFQILFRVNQRTFDPEKYVMILDDQAANAEADFNAEGMDIVPTAKAEMSSKMKRLQVAEIEMAQVPLVLQAGGNPIPIVKGYFEDIGSDKLDDIFPENGEITPQDQAKIDQMKQAQEQANQIQMMQLKLLEREQDRLDKETEAKVQEIGEKMKKLQAEIVETIAKAAKTAEEAETISLENQINTYTVQMQSYLDDLLAIGANNDRTLNQTLVPNNPGGLQ